MKNVGLRDMKILKLKFLSNSIRRTIWFIIAFQVVKRREFDNNFLLTTKVDNDDREKALKIYIDR